MTRTLPPAFHRESAAFVANRAGTTRHDQALWHMREKRDVARTTDWEALRNHAQAIKAHVLDTLPELAARFAAKARANGWIIHWCGDGAELNREVAAVLAAAKVRRVVKSKSMLTEECGLNPHLEAAGLEVVDTDLGERIVQFRHEPPSHIVLPAIHLTRGDIGDTFHQHLNTPAGETDPGRLVEAARGHLRERFLAAEAGITGVNFAVADTGGIVLCTNEGNADLGTALPPLHLACMGIEKLVPSLDDAAVFLRLLARSATGQPITAFTTHLAGPDPQRPGHAAHLFIVDNGRHRIANDAEHRRSLACIRCGACMNTCPVYRRASGHAYGTVVPGPIGAVLAPAMIGTKTAKELPFASTLCGSCTDVCPVKIDLHDQLLAWRRRIAAEGHLPLSKRLGMKIGAWVLTKPQLYAAGGWLARRMWPLLQWRWGPARAWTKDRDLPPAPAQSFRAQWAAGERGAGERRAPQVRPEGEKPNHG
jgi:L-lactate dehydrogenase complex protein LldF